MITYFKKGNATLIAVETAQALTSKEKERLQWLFTGAKPLKVRTVRGRYIGPRREMITPWSTNAVEMAHNIGITSPQRIELFTGAPDENTAFDPMLQAVYENPDQNVFTPTRTAEEIVEISDLRAYNEKEGLALSDEEITYLEQLSERLQRPLTDSEVFGFSQVNSEHCRHKIFNGTFVIDGKTMDQSLFQLIKQTSKENPNGLVSAYKDNVAFIKGSPVQRFAPADASKPDFFEEKEIDTVISLKAETHNFPTTVEPFNGAATGTGGEIRDRMGGGKASLPIAGTAVYMTGYPRPEEEREVEKNAPAPRPWLYQTPEQILIKASNGASDFGNKFGQPLICGSLLTFEHQEQDRLLAYDKVIMLAGGIGNAEADDAIKEVPEADMSVVVMGGDNYRIGMGGGAVSSVATGQYANAIELNAVQRANPEMQKRVSNVVRALAEMESNPCVSIHDHGAGGHLNALSELVEATGGQINVDALPVGDVTLSAKEIIGNESQERMGLVLRNEDVEKVRQIAEREQAPFYVVGKTTDDARFVFRQKDGRKPIDLAMSDMFGSSPKTIINDKEINHQYAPVSYDEALIEDYLRNVLQLEAVACKDWLTNKVDRSVTGRIARQQCVGELQLPLSDCGVAALDYHGKSGIATSIGHAPQAALISPEAGSVLSIAEALTNICGARMKEGLKSVSLSANWMWPCRIEGEGARLYRAVKACSEFARALGINIPTGKDSLSMSQQYASGRVDAPGTVIISAAGEVSDIHKVNSPVLKKIPSRLIYVDFSGDSLKLGGSAFAQSLNKVGDEAPTVRDPKMFAAAFEAIQTLTDRGLIPAQHDISAGGLITTLLEMTFANVHGGIRLNLDCFDEDLVHVLFAENPGLVIQVRDRDYTLVENELNSKNIPYKVLGRPQSIRRLVIEKGDRTLSLDIDALRDVWYKSSYLLDRKQSGEKQAQQRFNNYRRQPVRYTIPSEFPGRLTAHGLEEYRQAKSGIKAAIIREKGINGDREMAYSLYLAGFDVKDVHMTDLRSGREDLKNIDMLVFCGGFSNSDVLGSAKGWAGSFKYDDKARKALEDFYARKHTLSLGVCNGCQLMMELGLINPEAGERHPRMIHNDSHKFESGFVSVKIPESNSIMLGPLAGMKLGIWVAHGEGKFRFPDTMPEDQIALRYTYKAYPGNPNGSPGAVAGIVSADGRHLAMMPHLERAIFPWQCAEYPERRRNDQLTPWLTAFVNARKWIESNKK